MNITDEQLLQLSQMAFVRLDGAWFMAVAKKNGIEAAWELDIEAWKQLSYVIGKNLARSLLPDPVWPASFMEAVELLFRVMGIRGRNIARQEDRITITVTDCDMQKAIAKAGIADCGIATIATYEGLARGLFGRDFAVTVDHTRNLNHGDGVCEVVIRR